MSRSAASGGRHRLGIQRWHADDARRHAQLLLGGEQRLQAGELARLGGGADDVGGGFLVIDAPGHAHHHDDRLGLVADRGEGVFQRALGTVLADRGIDIGDQSRVVEGEGGVVGIFGGADHADDRRGNGADGTGTVIDFGDAHPVMVLVECHETS